MFCCIQSPEYNSQPLNYTHQKIKICKLKSSVTTDIPVGKISASNVDENACRDSVGIKHSHTLSQLDCVSRGQAEAPEGEETDAIYGDILQPPLCHRSEEK